MKKLVFTESAKIIKNANISFSRFMVVALQLKFYVIGICILVD